MEGRTASRLGWDGALRRRADLRPDNLSRHLRVDSHLFRRDAVPELLPAVVLLARWPSTSHASVFVQRSFQTRDGAAGVIDALCNLDARLHTFTREPSCCNRSSSGKRGADG